MSEVKQSASEKVCLLARGYRITKKIAEGSYAKVAAIKILRRWKFSSSRVKQVFAAEYKPENRANDSEKGSALACKVIDSSIAPEDFVKKFLPRELEILAKLNHPHVVHVHSIFQRRSKYFIFMRLAERGDLLEFIMGNGAATENQARVWLRQLALGLQYLHQMEIAHRDLKCENVLLTANYNVKLADFGFARSTVDRRGRRVLSETYCGSLSYAAPEILQLAPYNPKVSDIWSLGVVLYIVLNKAMPFDDANVKRLYERQMTRNWRFRDKVVAKLSDNAKKLVAHLLEPEVSKRWSLERVIRGDWIAMDPRLSVLTSAERAAFDRATEERSRIVERSTSKSVRALEPEQRKTDRAEQTSEEITIIKDAAARRPSGEAKQTTKQTPKNN